jgi:hypothetical protein
VSHRLDAFNLIDRESHYRPIHPQMLSDEHKTVLPRTATLTRANLKLRHYLKTASNCRFLQPIGYVL